MKCKRRGRIVKLLLILLLGISPISLLQKGIPPSGIELRRIKGEVGLSLVERCMLLPSLSSEERRALADELWEMYLSSPEEYQTQAEKIRTAISQGEEEWIQYAEIILDAVELRGRLEGKGTVLTGDVGKQQGALQRMLNSENYKFYTSEYKYTQGRAPEIIFDCAVRCGIPFEAVVRGIVGPDAYSGEIPIMTRLKEKVDSENPEFTLIVGGTGSEVSLGALTKMVELIKSKPEILRNILGEERFGLLDELKAEGFTVVIEPPWDDGGATRKRIEFIKRGNSQNGRRPHGWTPAVGDEARARGSLAARDIKSLLSYRIFKSEAELRENTGLTLQPDLYEKFVMWAANNMEQNIRKGNLDFTEHSPEFIFFLSNMLGAARIMDEVFTPEEQLGAALKNDFTLALRLQEQNSFDKLPKEEIDWQRFRRENIILLAAQDTDRGYVTLNSFEEGTLYVRLRDDNISFRLLEGEANEVFSFGFREGNPIVIINGKVKSPYATALVLDWAKENNITQYGDPENPQNFDFASALNDHIEDIIKFGNKEEREEEAKLFEIFKQKVQEGILAWEDVAGIIQRPYGYTEYVPFEIRYDEYDKTQPVVKIRVEVKNGDIIAYVNDDPRGISYSLYRTKFDVSPDQRESLTFQDEYGGALFRISYGTMVIQQTHITENFHLSPIKEFGTIDKYTALKSNPDADVQLLGTKSMVIVGPGSFYTSIMQNLIANADELYEMGLKEGHPPRVFVFNPYYDNETVGYTIKDMVKMLEKTLERHGRPYSFEELFDYVVISVPDTYRIAKWAYENGYLKEDPEVYPQVMIGFDYAQVLKQHPDLIEKLDLRAVAKYKEELEAGGLSGDKLWQEIGEFLQFIAKEMDKSEEARKIAMQRSSTAGFSAAAKLPRGPIIYTQQDIDFLKGKGYSDDQIILASIVSKVRKEKRKPGRAIFEEGAGYDLDLLAYVYLEILLKDLERRQGG